MPPILVYEHNRAYVIQQFHNGHFDYIDVVQEMAQRDFLRFVASTLLLERLASSYPWPRDKEKVPRRFYIAADMAMRLHGNHAFHGLLCLEISMNARCFGRWSIRSLRRWAKA